MTLNGKFITENFKLTGENVSGYILQADADGDAIWVEPSEAGLCTWAENTNNADIHRMAGNVGIGTSVTQNAKLTVNGKIIAKSMDITDNVPASDYVFEENYQLMPLNELETYVNTKYPYEQVHQQYNLGS